MIAERYKEQTMRSALLSLAALTACGWILRAAEPQPEPRAPVAGQPFDDREIAGYLEKEGRQLLAKGKVKALKAAARKCSIPLLSQRGDKTTLPQVAGTAEQATVVLGEFFKEKKSAEIQFSCAAGGFFVAENGLLVTSLHVVGEKTSRGFVALTRDGRVFPVREALAADPVDDLVVLQLDAADDVKFPTLPLSPNVAPIGTNVAVMSHPDEHYWMLTTGVVARNTLWRGEKGVEHYVCVTADFAKGSSGCPILDDRGNVVAIVNNTQSVYYDDDGKKKQLDLQMVVKNATPAWVARGLFEQAP